MKSWHHLISNPHRCNLNPVSVNKPAAGWNFINTSNCSQCERSLDMCGVGTGQKRPPLRRSACRSRAADSPDFWTHRHECGHFRFRQVSSGGSGFQRSPALGGSFLRGCVRCVYFVSPARPALYARTGIMTQGRGWNQTDQCSVIGGGWPRRGTGVNLLMCQTIHTIHFTKEPQLCLFHMCYIYI